MASSFFTRPEAELYVGTQNFSSKITLAPTDYGLTAAQALEYSDLNTLWRSAYEVANDPQQRTIGKVATKNNLEAQIREKSSQLAKIVEATPTVTDEQKIDLGLNVRKVPEPIGAPGTPTDFAVQVLPDGTLVLTWKCANPAGASGTTYNVFRRTTSTGPFDFLGTSGQRKFIDNTLPANSQQITYQIQAIRSTALGANAQFLVNFGFNSSGGFAAASVTPLKVAA
jgi:hypothetical protein